LGSIDLDVAGNNLRVTFDRDCPAEVIENVAVLRDGAVIEAFGSSTIAGPSRPNARYRVERPFDSEAFNPDLAEAVTRHLVMLCDERSGARLRAMFGRGAVRLRWSDWPRLSPIDRKSYLHGVSVIADVEVNGRIAARGSILRSLLGIGPSIQAWAVE
jgi:hypothetical protein